MNIMGEDEFSDIFMNHIPGGVIWQNKEQIDSLSEATYLSPTCRLSLPATKAEGEKDSGSKWGHVNTGLRFPREGGPFNAEKEFLWYTGAQARLGRGRVVRIRGERAECTYECA